MTMMTTTKFSMIDAQKTHRAFDGPILPLSQCTPLYPFLSSPVSFSRCAYCLLCIPGESGYGYSVSLINSMPFQSLLRSSQLYAPLRRQRALRLSRDQKYIQLSVVGQLPDSICQERGSWSRTIPFVFGIPLLGWCVPPLDRK